jgi:hypothetical protein
MYGGFNPFGDPNVNQAFEVPGGGLGGFSQIGASGPMGSASGGSPSPVASAESSLGLSPGPGSSGSAGTGNTGSSWFCGMFPNGVPGLPQVCGGMSGGAFGTPAGGATGSCSYTNIPACFPSIGDFATRAAVVVLGFVFVAAGLFMFGRQVPFVRHAVPHALRP